MTTEREQRHIEPDPDVRKAYRELAAETAPQHLNDAVLGAARKALLPGYARSRAWTRPLAWAATIVLTVAVILEINQLPDPAVVPGSAESQIPAAVTDDAAEAAVSQPAPAASTASRQAVPGSVGTEAGMAPSDAAAAPPPAPATLNESVAAEKREFSSAAAAKSQETLQRADQMIELQSAAAAKPRALAVEADSATCPEDVTADPASWLECIKDLRAAGMNAAADEQQRLLEAAFPDFESP